ncbi:MAG: GAF domain-containing protein, partial [Chloroflexi bacterium]|nr:GAF domain-containing protein [Chloroflexota bacterium]
MSLEEVALAICVETRQVVDYDNARVYILGGDGMTLEAVAFHADTEEYAGETADALRVSVGEGITGWVAQHGEPLIVTDASRDPRSLQIPGTPDVAEESMLLVPLRDDGAVTGVIVLSKLGIARFDQDDLRLLQILSDQAAIAIENARLLGARDRLVAELNCMLDISLTYAQADEELALAGLLSMKLARAGRADACIISRWQESAASLRTLGAHGVAVPDPTYDVLGSPVTRNVLRDARPEVLQAAGGHDPGEVRLMGTLDARTLLLLPLIAAGCTIGLVELLWVAAAKTFTPDELDVYRTMANQAGAVLENVRLLEQLRQAADIDQLTGVHNHRYLQE